MKSSQLWTVAAALAIGLLGTSGVALAGHNDDPCHNLQEALDSDPLAGVKARLSGQDFTGCDLSYANLSRATLRGADFTVAILVGTDFREAKLRGAILYEANLSCDPFGEGSGCIAEFPDDGAPDSNGADLKEADMGGTDLGGADLRGANLANAKLGGADLTDVIWGNTICPDETISDNNVGGTCEKNLK